MSNWVERNNQAKLNGFSVGHLLVIFDMQERELERRYGVTCYSDEVRDRFVKDSEVLKAMLMIGIRELAGILSDRKIVIVSGQFALGLVKMDLAVPWGTFTDFQYKFMKEGSEPVLGYAAEILGV